MVSTIDRIKKLTVAHNELLGDLKKCKLSRECNCDGECRCNKEKGGKANGKVPRGFAREAT